MNSLELLLVIGGILHFGILTAGALVPFVVDFPKQLAKVSNLMRQLVWAYAAYIFLTIIGFGIVSVVFASPLAAGTPLARAVCGYIAIFWIIRLVIQLFVFDVKPYLTNWFFRLGYHGLTIVFIYHSIVYSLAALTPHVVS